MKLAVQFVCAFAIGVTLSITGIGLTDWALYVVLILNAVANMVSQT